MRVQIQIARVDERNHDAFIVALSNNKIIVDNITIGKIQVWDLEDLKQCLIFV